MEHRRGIVIPLLAVSLIMFLAMVAFSVDVSYMQLVRSELRSATDAAAKAGAESLRMNQNGNSAKVAARNMAKSNDVAGQKLDLNMNDIDLGQAIQQSDGSWTFVNNAKPYRAVRVTSRLDGQQNPTASLFFGPVLGVKAFQPTFTAVAAHLDLDIYLCIDRSHSMCFDFSGVDWVYPSETPLYPDPICYPPGASSSRWAGLESAVDVFLNECEAASTTPRVGLITWGSTIGTNTVEYQLTGKTEVAVSQETGLLTNYIDIRNAIQRRGDNIMLGGTDMSAGLQAGVNAIISDTSRPLANKVIILMTDGKWTVGSDPMGAAQQAAAAGITVHCVTFLPGADQSQMVAIANATGGYHYYASDQTTLEQAFRELARLLPVTLTE